MSQGSVEDVLLAALERSSSPPHAAYYWLFISNCHIFSEAENKFKVIILNKWGGCCRAVWVKWKPQTHLEQERSRLGDQGSAVSSGWEGQKHVKERAFMSGSLWDAHTVLFLLSPALRHFDPSDESKNVFCSREASKFHARLTAGEC